MVDLYAKQLAFMDAWLADRKDRGDLKELAWATPSRWPTTQQGSLIIGQDIAVELGHPDDMSVALLLWGASGPPAGRNAIYLLGPDLPESKGRRLPFAKVVLIRGSGFNQTNTYIRYREMEAVRYDLGLRGYMLRAVSQLHREWSRVSHGALASGFSFEVLGGALIDVFMSIDYIDSVEILFVTSSSADVSEFQPIVNQVSHITAAMHAIDADMILDCSHCTFSELCDTVAGLRAMHRASEHHHGR